MYIFDKTDSYIYT